MGEKTLININGEWKNIEDTNTNYIQHSILDLRNDEFFNQCKCMAGKDGIIKLGGDEFPGRIEIEGGKVVVYQKLGGMIQ